MSLAREFHSLPTHPHTLYETGKQQQQQLSKPTNQQSSEAMDK